MFRDNPRPAGRFLGSTLVRIALSSLLSATVATAASAQTREHDLALIGRKNWTKVCGKSSATHQDICYTTRDFGVSTQVKPVLAVAVYDVAGDPNRLIRLLFPVGLMIDRGFGLWIDGGVAERGTFKVCFPNGCFAELKIPPNTLENLRNGGMLHLLVKNQRAEDVVFHVPLAGFGRAFDGRGIPAPPARPAPAGSRPASGRSI